MRLLIYLLLGSLSSLVTNTPIFEASNDDFLDFVPSLQPVDPDNIGFNTISLNDGLENIFSTANPDLSDDTLSTDDTMAPFDGLSSDMFGLEAQTDDLFGNPGSIAFADTSLPQFPVNQDDSSYEASPADSLIMSDANVPRGPPDCAGLRPNPQVSTSTAPYQTLCCVAPCMDVQSWRDKCSGWTAGCPVDQVACCQQFNGPDYNYTGFDCVLAPGYPFVELNYDFILNRIKCGA